MPDKSVEGKGKGKDEEPVIGEASYGVIAPPAAANTVISSGKRSQEKRKEINRDMAFQKLMGNQGASGDQGSSGKEER